MSPTTPAESSARTTANAAGFVEPSMTSPAANQAIANSTPRQMSPSEARATGPSPLDWHDGFLPRHIGPNEAEIAEMLQALGYRDMEAFIADVVPQAIRTDRSLTLAAPAAPTPKGEHQLLNDLKRIAQHNKVFRSCIGMGYHGTITPPVILRNILENPGWYTQYTPYQAEISQGRLEALLNFQTMIADLTGLPVANASLLDEATAAAEAMAMCVNVASKKPRRFFIADDCHPQTINVVRTRADSMGIEARRSASRGLKGCAGGGRRGRPRSWAMRTTCLNV